MTRTLGYAALAAYAATIPASNWLIDNVGTVCVPQGPCLIPVAPGILTPSGVLLVGAALVLRDVVQRALGLRWSLGAVLVGTLLAALIAPPALVTASAAAFLFSELADTAVYTPLQRRGLVLAVAASGAVGLLVDSTLFLWLAFGSLDHLTGQIIGKAEMVLLSLPLIDMARRGHLAPVASTSVGER
ncbi:VUT family protein [Azospirillum brasilense]|uniref:VUT family protein n=1 Tax=Azospirillum brasilense TaxID=192 RepID=UPI001ED9FFC5|nr:VUT family protein [Azospirillum brasilense]UKJ74567.1 VUT family protein [Azospirillum brasilense]